MATLLHHHGCLVGVETRSFSTSSASTPSPFALLVENAFLDTIFWRPSSYNGSILQPASLSRENTLEGKLKASFLAPRTGLQIPTSSHRPRRPAQFLDDRSPSTSW